jgi:predicted MFS family arabinose efflux permease
LQAWRNLAGGAIAAGLSWWAGVYLIDPNVFGNGYATTFMVAFLLTSAGLLALYLVMREPGSPTVKAQMPVLDRIREFPILLADRDYRNFLIALVFATMGRIAVPFCIIHAGRQMEVDGAVIGLFSLAFLGADTVTNLIWGTLGDRYGFRFTFIGTVAVWLISLVAMIFAIAPWHFLLAFFGLGAAMSGNMMSVTTLVLEFGHRDDIPMRLALSTTAETTVATLGPLLGGLVAMAFGLIPVFSLAIASLAIALAVLVWAVREPRHLNLVDVKESHGGISQ